jgi:lysophospholipase L1-like esterase
MSADALVQSFLSSLRFLSSLPIILSAFGIFSACHAGSTDDSSSATKWVGTWTTAPQLVEPGNNPPPPGLSNNTLRQIVRVSLGGDALRIRFSNEFSAGPVTFHEVHLAVSKGGGAIDSSSDRLLSFGGSNEITIEPGGAVTSDSLRFALQPRMDLAITIYYGSTSASITGHPGSRTTSYLLTGNAVSRVNFSGAVTTDHWYNINTIDVLAPTSAACVAILGNSITDGRGSTTNGQNRWPDIFSESLLTDSSTQHVAVLNAGIGGNCVLFGGLGPTGASRFDRDILNQQGVRWAIVFEGVNDIGKLSSATDATTKAANLITAYQQMIAKAHTKKLKIYGATIMALGNNYYSQYSEQCRGIVNQWIRTTGNFDACIDFDKVTRDPRDTTKLKIASFQNDGLHPDTAGHRLMGQSVDHSLFAGTDPSLGVNSPEATDGYALGQNYPNPFNPVTVIKYTVGGAGEAGAGVSGLGTSKTSLIVYDLLGREVATLVDEAKAPDSYEVGFKGNELASGMYAYRLTAGSFVLTRKMILLR